MLTLYAVAFQVKSIERTGISLPIPIIQITLFTRPPILALPRTEKPQEKINFFHSQPKSKVGEIVEGILKTDTPLSSTFY
jgi:hypothetical protein